MDQVHVIGHPMLCTDFGPIWFKVRQFLRIILIYWKSALGTRIFFISDIHLFICISCRSASIFMDVKGYNFLYGHHCIEWLVIVDRVVSTLRKRLQSLSTASSLHTPFHGRIWNVNYRTRQWFSQ